MHSKNAKVQWFQRFDNADQLIDAKIKSKTRSWKAFVLYYELFWPHLASMIEKKAKKSQPNFYLNFRQVIKKWRVYKSLKKGRKST